MPKPKGRRAEEDSPVSVGELHAPTDPPASLFGRDDKRELGRHVHQRIAAGPRRRRKVPDAEEALFDVDDVSPAEEMEALATSLAARAAEMLATIRAGNDRLEAKLRMLDVMAGTRGDPGA